MGISFVRPSVCPSIPQALSGLKSAYFRPDKADVRPDMADYRGPGGTDKRMGEAKLPLCSTGLCPLQDRCLKRKILQIQKVAIVVVVVQVLTHLTLHCAAVHRTHPTVQELIDLLQADS